jgi:NTP pyrophosphatase (non-canonical NTP hydrolase)
MQHDLSTFAGLIAQAEEFRDERDWRQFHSLRNVAAAIAIEAAELQEVLLWSTDSEEPSPDGRRRLGEELADVLIHCANLASAAAIDIPSALATKFALNESRYPIAKARGSSAKYDEL